MDNVGPLTIEENDPRESWSGSVTEAATENALTTPTTGAKLAATAKTFIPGLAGASTEGSIFSLYNYGYNPHFDRSIPEVKELVESVPTEYQAEVYNQGSLYQMKKKAGAIRSIIKANEVMGKMGFVESLAMGTLMVPFDPTTWVGAGVYGKISAARNMAKISRKKVVMQDALLVGVEAGASEALIQSASTEDLAPVAISFGTGLMLGGGLSGVGNLIGHWATKAETKKDFISKAENESAIYKPDPDTEAKWVDEENAANTADFADPENIKITQSKGSYWLNKIFGTKLTLSAHSRINKAAAEASDNSDGALSKRLAAVEALKHDTPTVQVEDIVTGANIHAAENASDIQHRLAGVIGEADKDKSVAYKQYREEFEAEFPDEKVPTLYEFEIKIERARNDMLNEYELRKEYNRADVLADEDQINTLKESLEKELFETVVDDSGVIKYKDDYMEEIAPYAEMVPESKQTTMDYDGNVKDLESPLKRTHEQDMYLEIALNQEIDKIVRDMTDAPDISIYPPSIQRALESNNNYAKRMMEEARAAGLDRRGSWDPEMYGHRMYDKEAITLADRDQVLDDFTDAILDGPEMRARRIEELDEFKDTYPELTQYMSSKEEEVAVNALWRLAGKPEISVAKKQMSADGKTEIGGAFDNKTGKIRISERKTAKDGSNMAVRHELTHAIFNKALDDDAGFRALVDNVINNAKLNAKRQGIDITHNGFKNAREFIAEVTTNAEFRSMLGKINYTGKKVQIDKEADHSILETLVGFMRETIAKLVSDAKVDRSALDAIDQVTGEYLGRTVDELPNVSGSRIEKIKKSKDPKVQGVYREARKKAVNVVNTLMKSNNMRDLLFSQTPSTPSALKHRRLSINANKISKYLNTNGAEVRQGYHYSMKGQISTNKVFKTSDVEKYMASLDPRITGEERELLREMFETTLGKRQIPSDPGTAYESIVRDIKAFNYLTDAGGFAKYGLSELGVAAAKLGFDNVINEIPAAAKMVNDMYHVKDFNANTPEGAQARDILRLTDGYEIYSNKNRSALGDTSDIDSMLRSGYDNKTLRNISETGRKMQETMFKLSGLEAVTVFTKIILPRAFMGRLFDNLAAGKPLSKTMKRWGFTDADMEGIKKVLDSKGWDKDKMQDFDFASWEDQALAHKTQRIIGRMSRDVILRHEAIRLPSWMTDGDASALLKLTKQFMSFTMMSYDRLLLAGLNDNKAMAAVGMVSSGALLGTVNWINEELLVATGVKDRDKAALPYNENADKFFRRLAVTQSYGSLPGNAMELAGFTEWDGGIFNGNFGQSGADVSRFMGGPTLNNMLQITRETKQFAGDPSLKEGLDIAKTITPLNNLIWYDWAVRAAIKGTENE